MCDQQPPEGQPIPDWYQKWINAENAGLRQEIKEWTNMIAHAAYRKLTETKAAPFLHCFPVGEAVNWIKCTERMPLLPDPLPKDTPGERGVLFVNRKHSAAQFCFPSDGYTAEAQFPLEKDINRDLYDVGWGREEWEWLEEIPRTPNPSRAGEPLDCHSEVGMTVGLIESLMAIAHVLVQRDWDDANISEALKDVRADDDLKRIMDVGELSSAKEYVEQQRKSINTLSEALAFANNLLKKQTERAREISPVFPWLKDLIDMGEDGYKLHRSNAVHQEFLEEDRETLSAARKYLTEATRPMPAPEVKPFDLENTASLNATASAMFAGKDNPAEQYFRCKEPWPRCPTQCDECFYAPTEQPAHVPDIHVGDIPEDLQKWIDIEIALQGIEVEGFHGIGAKNVSIAMYQKMKGELLSELEFLAGDMVCGTDQGRIYKRIQTLKK